MRIINYLLAVPKLLKHKLHLIPDKDCAVCKAGENPCNPTESEKEAEKYMFRNETKVIKESMRSELIQEYKNLKVFCIITEKNCSGEPIENSGFG